MKIRYLSVVLCVGVLVAAVWIGKQNAEDRKAEDAWTRVAPGVYRSPGSPAGYALVAGEHALLIDAPRAPRDSRRTACAKSMLSCSRIIIATQPPSPAVSWPTGCRYVRSAKPRPSG